MKQVVFVLVATAAAACGSVSKDNDPMPDAPVQQTGDFTLAVTPSPVRIVQGMTEPVTVTLTRTNYAGPVTLAVAGLPAGVTADPLTIGAGSDTGTLVLRSTGAAVLGSSAAATFTGAGDDSMADAEVQVYVQGARGSLDTTFNTTGKVVIPLGTSTTDDGGSGVAITPNGTIVVVGGGREGTGRYFAGAVAIKPDGQPETSMFTNGKHIGAYTAGTSTSDHFFAVTVQPDGKIVAAGFSGVGGQSHYFLVARFSTLGVLDTSFGVGGTGFNNSYFEAATGGDAKAHSVAVKPDGSIVASGFYYPPGGPSTLSTTARYTSAGALVGRLPAPPGTGQNGVGVRSDGSVLAVGPVGAAIGIARYTAADSLDAGFGSGTGATTATLRNMGSDYPNSLLVSPDNKFYVGGVTKNGANYEAAIARFTEAGALDSTFAGGAGYVTTPTNSPNVPFPMHSALAPDGSVILAYTLAGSTTDFAWVRVRTDGTIDTATNVVTTDFGGGADRATAVAIQADGRIVVAGTVTANGRANIGVARYWP